MSPNLKKCLRCCNNLPLENFSTCKFSKNKRLICDMCSVKMHNYYLTHKEQHRKSVINWLKNNPERRKEIENRSNQKNRIIRKNKVLTHYGGNPPKCACCGESNINFLTLDHINGGGRKERSETKQYGTAWYWQLIKDKYPKGLQVLCYNCNCGRSHNPKKICPHKLEEDVIGLIRKQF